MSRVSLIEQMYCKKKSALEFNYDNLWAPPIRALLTQDDINRLYKIATSLKYNANIELKYKLIDEVMVPRGFRKAHAGTNRVVYNFLEDPRFVAKIAVDRVGIKDTPAEYINQEYFKPFCCKIFEVDPTGVIGFVERVNPITSLEEFLSVSDDVFNMILTKIIGKYVVDDIGTDKYMNFGLRYSAEGYTFGPVLLDFPYAYELDGNKLRCNRKIKTPFGETPCGGEIDYDAGFNFLCCTKCGKTYQARDLATNNKNILIINSEGRTNTMPRTRIVDGNGKVISDSGLTSKTYVSKEQIKPFNNFDGSGKVSRTVREKYKGINEMRKSYYTTLQMDTFSNSSAPTIGDACNLSGNMKVSRTEEFDSALRKKNDANTISSNSTKKPIKPISKKCEEVKEQHHPDKEIDKAVDILVNSIFGDCEDENVRVIEKNDISTPEDELNDIMDSINNAVDEMVQDQDNEQFTAEDESEDEYEEQQELDLSSLKDKMYADDDEPDYSSYDTDFEEEPEEENTDDNEAMSYHEFVNEVKAARKKNNRKKFKSDDDMSEY